MSPQLFEQRQHAYDTEKLRFQVRVGADWVDIPGILGSSGPSESRASWRTDGPNDSRQRFESGKIDAGTLTLEGRDVPLGYGAEVLDNLKAAGSAGSTQMRLWFRGGTIYPVTGGDFKVSAPAAVGAAKTVLATVEMAPSGFNVGDLAGPNACLAIKGDSQANMKLFHIEQVISKLTFNISAISRDDNVATALAALAATNFGLIKTPYYEEWNGYVENFSSTRSQEAASDRSIAIRVNTKSERSADAEGAFALL